MRKHQPQCRTQLIRVDQKDDQTRRNVAQGHEGNERTRDSTDTGDPTKHDCPCKNHQHNAGNGRVEAKVGFQHLRDTIGLYAIADPKGRD